jgi:hypothetical protein
MTISPPEVPAEAAQRRVVELEARIAEQAVFIRLLKRNGSAVLARVGQDVLKDLQRSLQAARKQMTGQAAAQKIRPGLDRGGEALRENVVTDRRLSGNPQTSNPTR